jgi:hypothetical protein
MGFLDNSGDIILDAVLTDTGRYRLAKGDGTFRIAKFAFADDEINYGLYNKNHTSGSAYYDLEILQLPVLEAFTNNTSVVKSKLVSIPRTNLLYLPIIKIENVDTKASKMYPTLNTYIVTVDQATEGGADSDPVAGNFQATSGGNPAAKVGQSGVLAGFNMGLGQNHIEVHQGLDTTEIPFSMNIDPTLRETQYIVEIDNRLGSITNVANAAAPVSFIDDDNIASYFITQASTNFIDLGGSISSTDSTDSLISGPRGTKLSFRIQSSIELSTSTYLFTKLGSTMTDAGSTTFRYIDTMVRVTGATTGYRVDIPVRFVKYDAALN